MKPPGRSRKPEAMFCSTCAKREWLKLFGRVPTTAEERSIELKLRDWLGASRIQSAPCLSVCPEAGLSVARRGKTQVLSEEDLKVVNRQFDPTRQLTLFSDTINEDESTGGAGATS
ncbi:MAG: hypothetical protein IPJ84_08800 [Bdellovibrionales bacterium]|nr:hypothetical protein [Bdellovibrionales bacterium]